MHKQTSRFILALLLLVSAAACGIQRESDTTVTEPTGPVYYAGPPVLQDSYETTGNAAGWIGHVELVDLAERITVTKSYTVSAIQLWMYNVGNPNQNIVAGIYSHDAANNEPGSLLGSWSNPVSNADFPKTAPGTSITFTGLQVPVTPGTYWIVLRVVSGTGDNGSNYTVAAGTTETKRGECHNNQGWNEFMDAQVLFGLYSTN